ncbi:MAG: hypothetical protein K0S33_4194 [Bacteroidetes bacterium]|jgi:photosystem II stability/assembly factor-like uncharacterized protein|nr:hypothetical protein [Bacteroidota bacterium]
MRTKLLLIICLISCINLLKAQDPIFPTIPAVPAIPTFEPNAVFYLNQDTVVSVGDNGMVWRSTDGGFTYTVIPTFTGTENNNSVIMTGNYICIAGDSGTVTFSNNRGASWATAPQAQPLINYHDVGFADTTFGAAVGDNGDAVIYKWVGGLGWSHIVTGLTQKLNAVVSFKTSASIFTDGEAMAAGDGGVISHYQFGSWTNSQAPVTTRINDMYLFPDNATVIAVGDSGLILRSIDFGANWSIIQSGLTHNLNGVSEGINPNEIYAVGDSGVIYVSANAGLNFTRYTIGSNANLRTTSARTPRGAFAGSGSTLRTIVADTITITGVIGFPACPVDTIGAIFEYTGMYGAANQFTLQLSDPTGSFTNPTDIASITPGESPDTIAILTGIPASANYRLRVIASEPAIASDDNGADLIVTTGPPVPTISLSGDQTQLYTATVPNCTYQWSYNFVDIPGATDTIVTTIGNGTYIVVVTDANGCYRNNLPYNYNLTSLQKKEAPKFRVAPNPAQDAVYILNGALNSEVHIFNIMGEEVYKTRIHSVKQAINLEGFSSGVYFIKTGDQTQKLIKE